jgi:prephenate dehydrogenase
MVDPASHDRAVARVSHLPYLLAAALMKAADADTAAAGPSFLGATRVAGSPVPMWAQICRLNRREIMEAVRAFRGHLDRLEQALSDGGHLETLLDGARRARLSLSARGEAAPRGEGTPRVDAAPPAGGAPPETPAVTGEAGSRRDRS